jgi:hypothetical protein
MLFAHRVVAGVAEHDGHLPSTEGVLGAEQDRHAEAPEAVGRHQADGVATSRRQPATYPVGGETELLGGPANPLPGVGAQLARAVERFRGRAWSHAGKRRDVDDADPRSGTHSAAPSLPRFPV